MRTALIILILLISGCGKDSSTNKKPEKIISPLFSIVTSLGGCQAPEFFWSYALKVRANGANHFALVHHKGGPDKETLSTLYRCEHSGTLSTVSKGSESDQITDFDLDAKGEPVLLRSLESDVKDPWFDATLRELVIEDAQKRTIFHDETLVDALEYDADGVARESKPFSSTRSLFFTSFSTSRFANLIVHGTERYLSYVGTGGYRVAKIDMSGGHTILELMPNTPENSVLFDREAAPIAVNGGVIFSSLQFHIKDKSAYQNHFNRNLLATFTDEDGLLLQWHNIEGKLLKHINISGEWSIARSMVMISGDESYLLVNETQDAQRKTKVLVFNGGQTETHEIAYTSPLSGSSMTMCNGTFWVGGDLGFEQVRTGSVVKPADAFLWSLDLKNKKSSLRVFGTDRNDVVTHLDCSRDRLFVSGLENGPITHSGDNDSSQTYQSNFFGWLKD